MLIIKQVGKGTCSSCGKQSTGATVAYFADKAKEEFFCHDDLQKFLKGMGNHFLGEMVMKNGTEHIEELIGTEVGNRPENSEAGRTKNTPVKTGKEQ